MVGSSSERKIFVIGRRIERKGQFLGAALIAVPADLLLEFWVSLRLGRDSSVGLVREDGWLVARYPLPDDTIDLSQYVLFTTYLPAAPAGVYQADVSPADGVSRIVGYYTVPGTPLVTVAGISRDAIVGEFWSRIGRVVALALPIALALLLVSLWVARLLRSDERQRLELVQAIEQNRMLFREIHHRVKNNLQTVTALVQMQALPPEVKQELTGRIGAMTAIHEHIYSSDQFGRLDLAAYVRRLVTNLQESNAGDVHVRCDLAEIEVEAERALPLGLIINEVATNAFKHAFPDGRPGRIDISLKPEDDSSAVLLISDDGVGIDGEPGEGGMGSRLVKGLARQIGADYRYRRDGGTTFTMRFPLAAAE
jgi:two-component system, sensor histidine kinase PdtaS